MSKRHIAIWSVGDFLPGETVTGLSDERLAELVELGAVQAVDAPVPEPEPAVMGAVQVVDVSASVPNDPAKLTVEQLKAALSERGVEFDPKALKADLLALYGGA